MNPWKRKLRWRLSRSRYKLARRAARRMIPPPPAPPPIDVEIISMRAIVGGSLTLPYEIHWRGALHLDELERIAPEAADPGRAALHQAIRRYFTVEPCGGEKRLAHIGYTLPSLDAGDIVLIGAFAFIVTLDGEFKLATHNHGIAHGALLDAAIRDTACRLPDPYSGR
jgi:hypothetical protein